MCSAPDFEGIGNRAVPNNNLTLSCTSETEMAPKKKVAAKKAPVKKIAGKPAPKKAAPAKKTVVSSKKIAKASKKVAKKPTAAPAPAPVVVEVNFIH